jgi:putative acetyltransferase
MADVQIRAAEPRDAEDLAEVWNCPGVVAGTLQLPWRSVEHRRERLARADPDTHLLVAVIEGRAVGMLGLHLEPNPAAVAVRGSAWASHDASRGQGVGSALMAAMLDLADNWLGLRRVELTVFSDNTRAIRLYETFGFTVEGTARQFALRQGSYVDVHYMARLRPAWTDERER